MLKIFPVNMAEHASHRDVTGMDGGWVLQSSGDSDGSMRVQLPSSNIYTIAAALRKILINIESRDLYQLERNQFELVCSGNGDA